MRKQVVCPVLLALGLAALPLGAAAQSAQESTIAEAMFRDGQELLKAGKVSEACVKFASSYKIDPGLGTLLNLAVCHEKEGRLASAWAEYADAVAKAAKANDSAREEFARTHAKALEPKLVRGQVFVSHVTQGLEVFLDGVPLPQPAWGEAFPLDPGEHTLEAKAPNHVTWTGKLVVPASGIGPRLEIPALELTAPPPTAPPTAPAPAPAVHTAQARPANEPILKPVGGAVTETSQVQVPRVVIGAVITAVGLAGIGTAIGMGVKAKSLANDRDKLCPPSQPWCFSQTAFHDDHLARVDQAWSIGSAIVGGLALGAGTWFLVGGIVTDSPSAQPGPAPAAPKQEKKESKDDFSLWLAPQAAPQSVGFTLGGNF